MTSRIFKSIFISSVVVLIASVALVFVLCFDHYADRTVTELKREAEYIAEGYELGGISYIERTHADGVRIMIVAPDGRVTYDTSTPEDQLHTLDNRLEREEIQGALSDGVGVSERTSDGTSSVVVWYAIRLTDGDILCVSTAHESAGAMLVEMLTPIISLAIVVLVFAVIVAVKLSSDIVDPINSLDLDNPENNKVSTEIKPIIDKLSSQKYRILHQMSELKAREREFDSLTENMNVGMVVINSHTDVISCNRSAKRILGADSDATGILSLRDTPEFREAIRDALSGRRAVDYLRTDDKFYSIVITPVEHEGIVEGAVIVIIDDTEKEQRESLRREFTSNVSHELKTPLTSISGFAELIKCGMSTEEDTVHFAENIYREAQRLITLVGDIIRLNQLDGKEIPYDGEIDLYAVADEVVERIGNVADKAGVSITLSGAPTKVMGTYLILEEIIYNLIDNAIKYNREGGSVTVTVGTENSTPILRVSDTGIGIPHDKQDRVFERFYRVDKSHSKKIGGTGLGLSIVKHAALYHKATIALKSDERVGTTLTIAFPSVE